MKLPLFVSLVSIVSLASFADVIDIGGEITNPNTELGAGNSARCTNDAYFGWQTSSCSIDVDVNGFQFGLDNGNGNPLNYSGVISGNGTVWFKGAQAWASARFTPVQLTGSLPNSFVGDSSVGYGVLELSKDDDVIAIPGNIFVGGDNLVVNSNDTIAWASNNQIADTATITMQGSQSSYLLLNGHNDSVFGLILTSNCLVHTGNGGTLQVLFLTVDGDPQADGTYTSSESWIAGSGSVEVVPEPFMLFPAALAGLLLFSKKKGLSDRFLIS